MHEGSVRCLIGVAVLSVVALSVVPVKAYVSVGECPSSLPLLDPTTFECESCPQNASVVGDTCVCGQGFAYVSLAGSTTESFCENCAAQGKAVGMRNLSQNSSQYCVSCGGDTQLSCLVDAVYNASTFKCSCPSGSILTETVGTVVLSAQMCVPCAGGDCAACSFPYVPLDDENNGASTGCTCADGFTLLYDGSCVLTSTYDTMKTVAQGATVTSLSLVNEDNHGTTGTQRAVSIVQANAVGAAVLCQQGNMTACNYLANMCVIMQYNQHSVPCTLYLYLKKAGGCQDAYCEKPKDLPWIYYVRGTVDVLNDASNTFKATSEAPLEYIVSTYDLNGQWKGFVLLVDQVNLCRLSNIEFSKFFLAGDTRKVRCYNAWNWFLRADPTEFYELYLVNPNNSSQWIPVPVTVDYSNHDFKPSDSTYPWIQRESGNYDDGTPSANGLRRRFYAYDNVGGAAGGDAVQTYIAALWSAAVVLENSVSSRELRTPLFVLQYAMHDSTTADTETAVNVSSILTAQQLPLAGGGSGAVGVCNKSYFLAVNRNVRRGMMITLIVISSLCFVTAWLSTYGWMRRRQNLMLDFDALFRFFMYLCNHISNVYALVVAISSWYLLISYKSQHTLAVPLRFNEEYVNAMLYTAVVTKGVVVLYRIIEQCNADYFVIDWERTKGQLLRENKIVPVSMWRSTFLANELNELQTLRYLRPLLSMSIVFLFLIGLRYENLTLSVPHGTRKADATAVSMKTLRIAVDTFFWAAVALVIYLLEYQIFYRFVVAHPLQAFVDLCSVSNISVIVLTEPQFGFYIHGESIHAHADVSMEEFQNNLFLEVQGNLPVRGLGGQNKCQTFEVFLGPYTRQYLNICYTEMALEDNKAKSKAMKPINPMRWHCVAFFATFSRKQHVFSQAALAIKDRINYAFRQSVRRAEGTLLAKFGLQKVIDFPPNVMYMNGPQRGERGGRDLFFFDDALSYGKAFMCGIDFDLFVLYGLLFASIDSSLHNIYPALVLTYATELVLSWYRRKEGLANISMKTLIDHRFFI